MILDPPHMRLRVHFAGNVESVAAGSSKLGFKITLSPREVTVIFSAVTAPAASSAVVIAPDAILPAVIVSAAIEAQIPGLR